MIGEKPWKSSESDIDVLFVDDNEQWARLLASDIESEMEDVTVTVAGHAYEAQEALAEHANIDCIVADYRMPGESGIELLEHVREDQPQLPYLLMTSQGSETVAARALDAGATDYLIKDLGADQTTYFVNKIQTAVEHYRLRRAIEKSEERYRTVTEQSSDAIGVLQERSLIFCNERMLELTGRERQRLRGPETNIVTEIVHSQDREQVSRVFDNWAQGEQKHTLREVRIVRPDGTIRHCEYSGRSINHDGDSAILLSIRDVTERQRRKRELQWERELNRTVQRVLVESQTRSSLEQEVVEQLQRHGYALAWIAEQVNGSFATRAVGGDNGYLRAIDRSVQNESEASEPSVSTARTGDPKFRQKFDDLPPADWCETALTYGYRSGAAIPLVHNDVSYGLLAVYHERPERFDETEQRLLIDLANTVAFAVHSLETQSMLATDHTVEVTLQVEDPYYLVDLARDGAFGDCDSVCVHGTVPLDDEAVLQYLTVDGGSVTRIRDALDGHPDVRDVALTDEESTRVQVTATGPVPESLLASRGMVVHSTTVEPTAATIEVELPAKEDARSPVKTLEETFEAVSVRSVTTCEQREPSASDARLGTTELTEKQLAALKAAYFDGYFGQPRRSSATEVAESLDVAHSTFLRHLRVAQEKIFGMQFE